MQGILIMKVISLFLITISLLSGCINLKQTKDLNMYHVKMLKISDFDGEIVGLLCTNKSYHELLDKNPTPITIQIIDKNNKYYDDYFGSFGPLDEISKNLYNISNADVENLMGNHCGLGRKYPLVHLFRINLSQSKYRNEIIQNIKNTNSLQFVAYKAPFISFKPVLISENPSTIVFSDEQLSLLK